MEKIELIKSFADTIALRNTSESFIKNNKITSALCDFIEHAKDNRENMEIMAKLSAFSHPKAVKALLSLREKNIIDKCREKLLDAYIKSCPDIYRNTPYMEVYLTLRYIYYFSPKTQTAQRRIPIMFFQMLSDDDRCSAFARETELIGTTEYTIMEKCILDACRTFDSSMLIYFKMMAEVYLVFNSKVSYEEKAMRFIALNNNLKTVHPTLDTEWKKLIFESIPPEIPNVIPLWNIQDKTQVRVQPHLNFISGTPFNLKINPMLRMLSLQAKNSEDSDGIREKFNMMLDDLKNNDGRFSRFSILYLTAVKCLIPI